MIPPPKIKAIASSMGARAKPCLSMEEFVSLQESLALKLRKDVMASYEEFKENGYTYIHKQMVLLAPQL